MSTTVLKKQGKVEASDLYELAKKGLITHTGLFEVEGKNRDLKGLRGVNKEKLEDSEYLLQQGLVTVTFDKDLKVEKQEGGESKEETGKEQGKTEKPENGKTPAEGTPKPVENKEEKGNKEEAKPSVIKEEGSEVSEGLPLSEKPEASEEKSE